VFLLACGGAQDGIDHALQRMRKQPRADAYGASGVFGDGKVLQVPPAGTIPRERSLDPTLVTGLGSAAGHGLRVPLPVTPELLARGRSRFGIWCAACHGAGGFGGSVVAQNFVPPRPPPLRGGVAASLPPGQVYEVIRGGFGLMPSYAAELSVVDRWAVVAYVSSIRGRPPADREERDDSSRAAELQARDSATPRRAR
jgi:mono/diheme cytochrome c family protein